MSSFLDQPVRGFLDQLAARTPTPGGGGAAAVTGAMAAGLVAMAARFSAPSFPGPATWRTRPTSCAAGWPTWPTSTPAPTRPCSTPAAGPGRRTARERTREALLAAAVVPLEIAEIGARVARMAVRVAEAGNPNLRGDAVTGALLAAASARSAACLVDINVRLGGLDPELSRRAARAAADAGDAAGRATMSTERAGKER